MASIRWYQGDIHNHEDGTIPIESHVEEMRRVGYDFICLQYKDMEDPAKIRDPGEISREDLLVIAGAEQAFRSVEDRWAHFGFIPFKIPMPDTITDRLDIRQGLMEADRRSPGCIKVIHHPSDCRWRMEDFRSAHQGGVRFFEVNPCDEDMEYALDLWDECLSSGLDFKVTLSTDAHGWRGVRRWGFVMAQTPTLDQEGILSSLSGGDFVAVTEGCRAKPISISRPAGEPGDEYSISCDGSSEIKFLGPRRKVLQSDGGGESSYTIQGDEIFVRGEAFDPAGLRFFTQPVILPR